MRLAFSLLLFALPTVSFALDPSHSISQYGHMMWTLQDGMLPGAPTEMTQTKDGYLWIGTRAGLVRFDGVRFVPFTPPSGEQLLSNRIMSLRAASDGSLWIGTRSGLAHWHQGHLSHYPDAAGTIMSILEDRAGKIWFTRVRIEDGNGPLCEVQGDRALCHGAADGVPISVARQLSADSQGNLWTVSNSTVMRWRPGSTRTYLPAGITSVRNESLDIVQNVLPAADGSVWVGAMQPSRGLGLLRLIDDKLQSFVTPQLDGRKLSVAQLFLDRQNALWIGTQDEGVYRVHGDEVSHYRRQDGLSSDTVENLFEDREGTLWVLTDQGIDAFRDLRVVSITSREGLSANLAHAVLASRDGTVWINTWHSLDALRQGKITALSARNGLPGEEPGAMYEDPTGTLWFVVDRDLFVFEGGKFQPIKRPDGSPIGSSLEMIADVSGDLWTISGETNLLSRIHDRKVVDEIPRADVPFAIARSIVADPQEGIWFPLTNGDLGRYRRGRLETVEFHRAPGRGLVWGLVAYPDGSIIGGTSLGLIGWRNGKSQTMTAANGLPCEEVHTLLTDRREGLWLYASCGIIFIANDQVQAWWQHPDVQVKLRLFDAADGAHPALSNRYPRASRSPDGRLWFANSSVVQVIDPEHLEGNTLAPAVHIEQFIADRKTFAPQSRLRLPPLTRDVQIDYTGLSFVVPRKTQFRYRLEGHDGDWQDAGVRRQAFYTDLPPGDYRFRVIASNNDGVWNPSGASLDFAIAPAFYQTRWFAALCIASAAGVLWLLFRLRVRQIETTMRMRLEERVVERERIARELHDTLLQNLLSASLQLSVANSTIPADAAAKPLVERILQLLRRVVDEGRNAVHDLRARDSQRDALERAFAQIPQDLAVDQKIEYRLIVEGTRRALRPLVREEVYRIGREALANAFRHSRGSVVETVLEYAHDRFRMVIRDDGCGMDPQVVRAGREGHWGLPGMRERSEKIGAQLKVLSGAGAGTEIDLIVPGSTAFESSTSRPWIGWLPRFYRRREQA